MKFNKVITTQLLKRRHHFRRRKLMHSTRIMCFFIFVTVFMLQGCVAALFGAGAGAGAGTYAYVRGEQKVSYPKPLGITYNATLAALKSLEMPILTSTKDLTDGTIEARKGDGSTVNIRLSRESDQVTTVRIRVGVLGDEASSKLISDKIAKQLGI